MNVAVVALLALSALAVGYLIYGRFVARALGVDPDRRTPAAEINDGRDYIPTRPVVLFGHHYASIAAAGPIIGPALAALYGWLPALLWMVFGVIFIGAVHDFSALFVTVRAGGKSVAEVARQTLGTAGFLFYALFALLLCILVAAAFLGLTATALTSLHPAEKLGLEAGDTLLETRLVPGELRARVGAAFARSLDELRGKNGIDAATLKEIKTGWADVLRGKPYDDSTTSPTARAALEAMNYPQALTDVPRAIVYEETADGELRRQWLDLIANRPDAAKAIMARQDDPAMYTLGVVQGRLGGIASTSVIVITCFAPLLGFLIYRKRMPVLPMSVLALGICALSIWIGFQLPVKLDYSPVVGSLTGIQLWMIIVLAYCVVAGWISIWIILQPRDFINVHLLYIGLAVMIVGIVASGLKGVTLDPAYMTNIGEAETTPALGLIWPVLFVTIACGSVSGAHGLVCGGTTCKQVASERHLRPIGYGGMMLETVLGICVLLVILGSLGLTEYRNIVWPAGDKGNAPLAFALGVGASLNTGLGVPKSYGTVFGILLLEGFLITTTDTIIRLARYLTQEIWKTLWKGGPKFLTNPLFNTALVVAIVALFAFTDYKGEASWKVIWPIFGSANQLLAALTLIVATAFVLKIGRNYWVTLVPALFMIVTTVVALIYYTQRHIDQNKPAVLIAMDFVLLALAAGFIVMTGVFLTRIRRIRAEGPGA